jgi:hypothetical protein
MAFCAGAGGLAGGLPNDQFPPVNQLLVAVAFQISSCANKTDNRKKRKPNVIAIDQQLPPRETIKNRFEPFTLVFVAGFCPA